MNSAAYHVEPQSFDRACRVHRHVRFRPNSSVRLLELNPTVYRGCNRLTAAEQTPPVDFERRHFWLSQLPPQAQRSRSSALRAWSAPDTSTSTRCPRSCWRRYLSGRRAWGTAEASALQELLAKVAKDSSPLIIPTTANATCTPPPRICALGVWCGLRRSLVPLPKTLLDRAVRLGDGEKRKRGRRCAASAPIRDD